MNAIAFKCIFSPYDRKCFIALHRFFTSVFEYNLNQFPCHRHVFGKTVNKQISHALQSRPLPIRISSNFAIFFIQLTPNIFRGNLPSEKVEELISLNFQVSECYCEFLYRQAVHTGFLQVFPRHGRGKHTYIAVQGCCFLREEITSSAFKV